ncbi:membrane-associating domain-containing protein [Achaetomium macrosporum]|uniref:Membrane-associating domain-containing protein n=1 Tax=Achaetomium macrosporum TaxID=79813 RepID=A0AAN7C5H4_9PEZI|nr:membrane-associating domain-containing protein [Achaetomium macrosporum]
MSLPLPLIIRVTQGVFALIVLSLSGFVAHWYNTVTAFPSPPEINFLIFGAIWSWLSLVCIEVLPRFLPRTPKAYIAAPFDLTNTLFWFSGCIALSVFLGKLFFCRGSVCHAARADVAFGAFSFIIWAVSTLLTALEIVRARRGHGHAGTGAVPMPAMKESAA